VLEGGWAEAQVKAARGDRTTELLRAIAGSQELHFAYPRRVGFLEPSPRIDRGDARWAEQRSLDVASDWLGQEESVFRFHSGSVAGCTSFLGFDSRSGRAIVVWSNASGPDYSTLCLERIARRVLGQPAVLEKQQEESGG
jgi:hypothetical protein